MPPRRAAGGANHGENARWFQGWASGRRTARDACVNDGPVSRYLCGRASSSFSMLAYDPAELGAFRTSIC